MVLLVCALRMKTCRKYNLLRMKLELLKFDTDFRNLSTLPPAIFGYCLNQIEVMSNYLFSQFKANEFEDLHQVLSKVLDIPQDQLKSLYEMMQQEFELDYWPPEPTLPRSIFQPDDGSFQKCYEEAFIIGVDIPSLLEKKDDNPNKKTIAILGQDPLRSKPERVKDIMIGTPYGLHLKKCRDEWRTKQYFDLVKVLLDEGYRIYLTDIFKVWVSKADCDRGIHLNERDRIRFIQVLKSELEIFQPLAVITWGKEASNAMKGINLETKHLDFPHPSGAANGAWSKLMGKPATQENKVHFWREKVLSCL